MSENLSSNEQSVNLELIKLLEEKAEQYKDEKCIKSISLYSENKF